MPKDTAPHSPAQRPSAPLPRVRRTLLDGVPDPAAPIRPEKRLRLERAFRRAESKWRARERMDARCARRLLQLAATELEMFEQDEWDRIRAGRLCASPPSTRVTSTLSNMLREWLDRGHSSLLDLARRKFSSRPPKSAVVERYEDFASLYAFLAREPNWKGYIRDPDFIGTISKEWGISRDLAGRWSNRVGRASTLLQECLPYPAPQPARSREDAEFLVSVCESAARSYRIEGPAGSATRASKWDGMKPERDERRERRRAAAWTPAKTQRKAPRRTSTRR